MKTIFKTITRLLPLHQPTACEFIRRGKKRQTEFTLKTLEWDYTPSGWGITLSQPDKAMARKYQQPGIIVTNVERGRGLSDVLKRGDFIYQIDDIKIHSLEFFKIVVDELIRTQSGMQLYLNETASIKQFPSLLIETIDGDKCFKKLSVRIATQCFQQSVFG